jgi:hypothetical protein
MQRNSVLHVISDYRFHSLVVSDSTTDWVKATQVCYTAEVIVSIACRRHYIHGVNKVFAGV